MTAEYWFGLPKLASSGATASYVPTPESEEGPPLPLLSARRPSLSCSSPREAALRRLNESCALLTLERAARTELRELLLAETPPLAQRVEHDLMLRRRLEEQQVFRLSVGEAQELLASVQEEGEDE